MKNNLKNIAIGCCAVFFSATSYFGVINMLYEPSVSSQLLSANHAAQNASATGYFQIDGAPTYIHNSSILSNLPSGHSQEVMGFVADYYGYGAISYQATYISSENTYSNTISGGVGTLKYMLGNGARAQDSVVFDGDLAEYFAFHFVNPYLGSITMRNMTIADLSGNTVFFERTGGYGNNYKILLDNNAFALYNSDGANGIYMKNFNNDSDFDNINITNNRFEGVTTSYAGIMNAAITLENTTGNVMGNIITDSSYTYGIVITSPGGTTVFPYLCNNIIKHMSKNGEGFGGVGILSDNNQGYVKLCQIDSCVVGFQSGSNDNSKIVASSILNSKDKGIFILGNGATHPADIDLTGVHGHSNDYAAFDTITGTIATGHSQVLLADSNQEVDYGLIPGMTWNHYGHNNTIGTTEIGITSGSKDVKNIDSNSWGGGDAIVGTGITYDSIPSKFFTSYTHWSGSISCSGGFEENKPNGSEALSVDNPISVDTCTQLRTWKYFKPQSQQEFKEQYDTLRLYIEKCAASDNQSYDVFSTMEGAVERYSSDTTRYDIFRNWLISVLYLNTTNPSYFCACMGSIADSYQYGKYYLLGGLAVHNYLRTYHPGCLGINDSADYANDTNYVRSEGLDPTKLPPLDSIGLGFLDSLSSVQPTTSPSRTYLASFTSNPNPFENEITLQFALNRMMYTTVGIYDDLGRWVWGDGRGYSLEAGEHTIKIDASSFASGTFYARISTGFGEVQTLKLVHEK